MINKNTPQKLLEVLNIKDKTLTVQEVQIKKHAKYEKTYKRHKKFLVHTDNLDIKVGDTVIILGSKPISAKKRWRFYKKVIEKGNK
ncbi:MAG: 30S ribosomal protein S17 [bacterium]